MRLLTLLVLTLIGAPPGAASNADSVLDVPRTGDAPQLANFLDMSPAGETPMAKVRGSVQRVPRDGDESTQRTEVYLSYDDSNLYVVFVAFDDDPAQIRARMVARGEQVLDDDLVSIQIDSFRDQRRATLSLPILSGSRTPASGSKARAGITPSTRCGTRKVKGRSAVTSSGCLSLSGVSGSPPFPSRPGV